MAKCPSAARLFCAMADPSDGSYSNAFEVFMRGEEVVWGAQRAHDVEILKARAIAMLVEAGVESMQRYIDPSNAKHRHGIAVAHG